MLKGIRLFERNAGGVLAMYGNVYRSGDSIYGSYMSIPDELIELPKEPGYYTVDGDKINVEDWVDPVDWIPENLLPEFKYLAMDEDCRWYIHISQPNQDEDEWVEGGYTECLSDIIETNFDPLGWKNSLHVRGEDGMWRRV